MNQPPTIPPHVPGQPHTTPTWPPHTTPTWQQPPSPQSPKKKNNLLLFVIIGTVTGTIVAIVVTLILSGGQSRNTGAPVKQATAPGVVAEPNPFDADGLGFEDPTTEGPSVPTVTPGKGDFDLKAKITDKQCFGSAGCNVEFEVEVTYNGAPLDEDVTWQITYEATGVEDGPIIGTFEVTGTKYEQPTEMAGTKRKSDKITIKVTDIERSGY